MAQTQNDETEQGKKTVDALTQSVGASVIEPCRNGASSPLTTSQETKDMFTNQLAEIAARGIAFCESKSVIADKLSRLCYGVNDDTGEPKKLITSELYRKVCDKGRAYLRVRASIGMDEARQDSIGFYENMVADHDMSPTARVRCRENLDKIMGVAVPDVTINVGGKTNGTVTLGELGLDLSAKKAALAKMRAAREAHEAGQTV